MERGSRGPVRYSGVFVDFENLYYTVLDLHDGDPERALADAMDILTALRSRLREEFGCEMAIGRSYGDFDRLEGDAQGHLQLLGFEPRFMLATPHKGSSDLLLSIDAIEMLLTRPQLDTFVIVGGDRDYLPIVRRIREHMKRVLLVGFRRGTSGDLRQVVGEENFLPAEALLTSRGARPRRPEPPGELGPDPVDEERCLRLVMKADRQYRGRGIWMTPFLRELNDRFPYLDNRGRKRLLERLQERGAIRIEKIDGDPHPYSVIQIDWDNPWVAEFDEEEPEDES